MATGAIRKTNTTEGLNMEESTKALLLEIKAKAHNIEALAYEIKNLARECANKIDEEARKNGP